MTERRHLRIRGVVQGVGFRPFVFRLATGLGLGGLVGNDADGVFIEIEGAVGLLHQFQERLLEESPALARIDHVEWQTMTVCGDRHFSIADSSSGSGSTLLPPDQALCRQCRQELLDPRDRRYAYPFLNCTQCGPRFTIIQATPYDRPSTTMDSFPMCSECLSEYHDPANRRFHAQPNACAQCGPRLQWWQGDSMQDNGPVLDWAVQLLNSGGILAIKGLGGFHLACDADNAASVARLRQLKHRPHQPWACMARDLETLKGRVQVDEDEARLLQEPSRPIVILGGGQLAAMLPYTGLHELLLQQGPELLVMTSANPPGSPIEYRHPKKLLSMADAVLSHNRDIYVPCDDSVAFVFGGIPTLLRRSRGFAPLPIELPNALEPLLAVGGELKNTFCLTQGRQAFLSQHLGDMQNLETLETFERCLENFQRLFQVRPQAIAVDLHPAYLSRRWAERQQLPLVEVQHHHAHLAALMVEHKLTPGQELLGFCFDGTGYGPDATIWGGECLLASYSGYRRMAHLTPMPVVGGDSSIRCPYRLALTYLWACQLDDRGIECPGHEATLLRKQWELGNFVATSSMGRLFDVVSCLTGLCQKVTFEGQAAMLLQNCYDAEELGAYDFDQRWDVAELLAQVVADVAHRLAPGRISARFHRALARAIRLQAKAFGADRVGLTGGVFQNRQLLELTVHELNQVGVEALWHRQIPPNDGGIAVGQIAVAGARLS